MKILLANKFSYLKGGSDICYFENAKLLESKGDQVILFSMIHPNNILSEYEKYFVSNVDYERPGARNKIDVALKLLYSFEARKNIERLIRDDKPDIAHLHNIHHQISPSILHSLKKFNIPIVLTLHDYKMVCASYSMLCDGKACEVCRGGKYYNCFLKGCVKDSQIKSLLNTIEMYLHHKILHIYDIIDIFISPSRFLKNKLEEMGFKGKIVYLPNSLKLDEFEPQYEWDENSIVYFGRLSKEKGLFTLIDAIKDNFNICLKIIGEGPLKNELASKAKAENINVVSFLGYKAGEELKKEIRNSMFVVLPSEWYENNPLTIIEGFALGKPAVGARIGGISELVIDGKTGMLFDSGNADDLSLKIEYLLNNPNKIVKMGRNARIFVEQKLNAEKHYQKLMEIYDQAIGHKFI